MPKATPTKSDDSKHVKLIHAKIDDDSKLKVILETVKNISPKALFDFSKSGLVLKAMNETFSAMINVSLKPSFFKEFNAPDTSVIAKIDLTDLRKIIGIARNDEEIDIQFDKQSGSLIITLQEKETEKSAEEQPKTDERTKSTFTLASMSLDESVDTDTDPYKIDIYALGLMSGLDFNAPSKAISQIVQRVGVIGDDVSFTVHSDHVIVESVSESNKNKAWMNLKPGEGTKDLITKITLSDDESISTRFRINELSNLVKLDGISSTTKLLIEKEKPGLFVFEVLKEGETENPLLAKIGMMIAPVASKDQEYATEDDTKQSSTDDTSGDSDDDVDEEADDDSDEQ